MADPFEVRMRFTSQLQHLNASTSSALKAANYALRHAEFSDDLHSCILEQLERNNMNNRANIMYFLPALCDTAKAQNEMGYVRMMERDIGRIIDLVAPEDGSGAANVKVVRKVLQQLQTKSFLQPITVGELEEYIVGRDGGAGIEVGGGQAGHQHQVQHGKRGQSGARGGRGSDGLGGGDTGSAWTVSSTPQSAAHGDGAAFFGNGMRLDKRQIEQRIEEDRERHKRAREHIWAVPQSTTDPAQDEEFIKIWFDTADVVEDDYQLAREEADERRRHLEFDDL